MNGCILNDLFFIILYNRYISGRDLWINNYFKKRNNKDKLINLKSSIDVGW
jgi:hypothetical protein